MEAKKFPNKTIESAKEVIFRWAYIGMSLGSHLHMLMIKLDTGPIFLRQFRLYVLCFMFRFMFANTCFEKNENSKIYVTLIINIT